MTIELWKKQNNETYTITCKLSTLSLKKCAQIDYIIISYFLTHFIFVGVVVPLLVGQTYRQTLSSQLFDLKTVTHENIHCPFFLCITSSGIQVKMTPSNSKIDDVPKSGRETLNYSTNIDQLVCIDIAFWSSSLSTLHSHLITFFDIRFGFCAILFVVHPEEKYVNTLKISHIIRSIDKIQFDISIWI